MALQASDRCLIWNHVFIFLRGFSPRAKRTLNSNECVDSFFYGSSPEGGGRVTVRAADLFSCWLRPYSIELQGKFTKNA